MKPRNFVPDIPVVSQEEAERNPRPDKARIVVPDCAEGHEAMERILTNRRCGYCRHFSLRRGQEIIRNPHDPLMIRMIKEMKIKSISDNIDWNELGLCEHWTGGRGEEFFTCSTSPARVHRHRLDSNCDYTRKDDNLKCPVYEPRGSDDKEIRSYRSVKGGRTIGTD